jgi:hypothetical protein
MIPTSFEPMKARLQTGRVTVTGGQESIAVGRPHITNQAFAQALVASIKKFQTFSNVIEDQGSGEEYLLTVTRRRCLVSTIPPIAVGTRRDYILKRPTVPE